MLLFSLIDQILVDVPFVSFGIFHFLSSFFLKRLRLSTQILRNLSSSILC